MVLMFNPKKKFPAVKLSTVENMKYVKTIKNVENYNGNETLLNQNNPGPKDIPTLVSKPGPNLVANLGPMGTPKFVSISIGQWQRLNSRIKIICDESIFWNVSPTVKPKIDSNHHLCDDDAINGTYYAPMFGTHAEYVQGHGAICFLRDKEKQDTAEIWAYVHRTAVCFAAALLAQINNGNALKFVIGIIFAWFIKVLVRDTKPFDKLILPAVCIAGMRLKYKPRYILVDQYLRVHASIRVWIANQTKQQEYMQHLITHIKLCRSLDPDTAHVRPNVCIILLVIWLATWLPIIHCLNGDHNAHGLQIDNVAMSNNYQTSMLKNMSMPNQTAEILHWNMSSGSKTKHETNGVNLQTQSRSGTHTCTAHLSNTQVKCYACNAHFNQTKQGGYACASVATYPQVSCIGSSRTQRNVPKFTTPLSLAYAAASKHVGKAELAPHGTSVASQVCRKGCSSQRHARDRVAGTPHDESNGTISGRRRYARYPCAPTGIYHDSRSQCANPPNLRTAPCSSGWQWTKEGQRQGWRKRWQGIQKFCQRQRQQREKAKGYRKRQKGQRGEGQRQTGQRQGQRQSEASASRVLVKRSATSRIVGQKGQTSGQRSCCPRSLPSAYMDQCSGESCNGCIGDSKALKEGQHPSERICRNSLCRLRHVRPKHSGGSWNCAADDQRRGSMAEGAPTKRQVANDRSWIQGNYPRCKFRIDSSKFHCKLSQET